jgi:pilus assembly protein Flp/PilA
MREYLKGYLALKADTKAVTALEYGLVAALIAVAIIAALTKLGGNLNSTFNNIATTIA